MDIMYGNYMRSMQVYLRTWAGILLFICVTALGSVSICAADAAESNPGRDTYRYFCYQCHGYSGDANTLAASYLAIRPRDFTIQREDSLPRARMFDAVRNGRNGTAMVGFSSVLDDVEIENVVDYIRRSFMTDAPLVEKYHSAENGWMNHDRYSSAYPFVLGTITRDKPWEELDSEEKAGRQLYESACVTCHDQPNSATGTPTWEPRAVSYPREHFSHRLESTDFVSSASPYARHDVATMPANMSDSVKRGMRLYQENCAFCHAADGTARNWIGSFMDPRPRDFTSPDFALLEAPRPLREIIKGGVANSSMPAWRAVLSDDEIDDIIEYMRAAFAGSAVN